MSPEDLVIVARRDAHNARLRATRDAARAAAGLLPLAPYTPPAPRVAAVPTPAAPVILPPAPKTAAELAFDAVKAAALARIAAEERVAAEAESARQAARQAEDDAVASIINSRAGALGQS